MLQSMRNTSPRIVIIQMWLSAAARFGYDVATSNHPRIFLYLDACNSLDYLQLLSKDRMQSYDQMKYNKLRIKNWYLSGVFFQGSGDSKYLTVNSANTLLLRYCLLWSSLCVFDCLQVKNQQALFLSFFHLVFLDPSKKYPKRTPTPSDEIMTYTRQKGKGAAMINLSQWYPTFLTRISVCLLIRFLLLQHKIKGDIHACPSNCPSLWQWS